jgi:DNA-binding response OmpR family regulator
VARSLDLLPSLLMGVPVSARPSPEVRSDRVATTRPLSVLIFGAQPLADAIAEIPGAHVECERTEDLARAHERARLSGPDLAIIDADCPGARELVAAFGEDPNVEPVPVVVVGDFGTPEASSAFIALGAARVLAKPVSKDALQRTVVELRGLAAEPRLGREPLGELSVEALAERIAGEIRRGLLDAVEPSARGTSVGFGDGADVMAAVWGAVARVRELVTLRSSGAVRFDSSGPEGAVPMAAWSSDERRAGDRGAPGSEVRSGDGVSLQGRRIVVADDDPAVVWFMSGLLKALGVEVLEAHDGARALALTYESWPDLVVSDVLMPELDGFSLCHEIKRDVAVRDVPVILLSWKEDLLQRVRELGGGADGYLRKEAAASTVAERLREVLRPRARVEQRIAAGGDARGRLDGLTPRLILELAASGGRDVRVGIRDAVYLYEVQVRRGCVCSATRSSADGSFERGDFVLAALLGVSAGRFTVEPDASHCRVDFEGSVPEILKGHIERARSALSSISAGALAGVTRVHVTTPIIQGYLACTPDPARTLLEKIINGASPRALITSGAVSPRLLEAVLSDVARRGAVRAIEREGRELSRSQSVVPRRSRTPAGPPVLTTPPEADLARGVAERAMPLGSAHSESIPVTPAPAAVKTGAAEDSADEAGWFSLQVESSAEPVPVAVAAPSTETDRPVVDAQPGVLPFNSEVTPSVTGAWGSVPEGVLADPSTLQGVGLPEVSAGKSERPIVPAEHAPVASPPDSEPLPTAAESNSPATSVSPSQPLRASSPDELDALASALTEASPSPSPVAAEPVLTQVMAAVDPPSGPKTASEGAPEAARERPEPPPTVQSPTSVASPSGPRSSVSPSRVSALKVSLPPPAAPAVVENPGSGWLLRLLVVAGLAFGVAYAVVTFLRLESAPEPAKPASAPATATS